jgi:glutathione S-transferase
MNIVFYGAPMSSATPVASTLRELEVPHERVVLDLKAQDQKKPAFLALNPNGKVPTLVVDGTPMFEALAIMQWLGDRFGVARKLWPAPDAPSRLTALSWTTWAYVTYAATLQQLNLAQSPRVPAELHSERLAKHAQGELSSLLSLLDAQLGKGAYLLGAEYSLADLIVASTIQYGIFCGAAIDAYPHLNKWAARCQERPAMRAEWG